MEQKSELNSLNIALSDALGLERQAGATATMSAVALSSNPFGSKQSVKDSSSGKKSTVAKAAKKKKWKKPKDKPKRPLSAYNIFFQKERENLLYECEMFSTNGEITRRKRKIGFADLAKSIAAKWKTLKKDEKKIYEAEAQIEQTRYRRELDEWKRNQTRRKNEASEWTARRADVVTKMLSSGNAQALLHNRNNDSLMSQVMMSYLLNANQNPFNHQRQNGNLASSLNSFASLAGTNSTMALHNELMSQLNYLTGGPTDLPQRQQRQQQVEQEQNSVSVFSLGANNSVEEQPDLGRQISLPLSGNFASAIPTELSRRTSMPVTFESQQDFEPLSLANSNDNFTNHMASEITPNQTFSNFLAGKKVGGNGLGRSPQNNAGTGTDDNNGLQIEEPQAIDLSNMMKDGNDALAHFAVGDNYEW